ncbi:MAG: hypothetical protein HUU11_02020 [Anaerolineales bacterium]|nr:hypothetical protein [Anaerolineales bacterium]
MTSNFRLREVRIEIQPGVTLIADVSDISELKELLQFLSSENVMTLQAPSNENAKEIFSQPDSNEDPNSILELRAELPQGSLLTKKVLAFKNSVPQLLRTGLYGNVTEAILVLLYAIETGLKSPSISYDSFKPLYEGQGLKSGSSLPMLLNNLKNTGYIDKKLYDGDRTLSLSPKGNQKAIEVLKSIVNSS